MRFLNKKQAGGTQPFRAFPDPSRKNTLIRGYIYIEAARYAEWGAGSEKRVIAVNVPLLKGEVPAAQAVEFGIRRPWPLQSMAANGRR